MDPVLTQLFPPLRVRVSPFCPALHSPGKPSGRKSEDRTTPELPGGHCEDLGLCPPRGVFRSSLFPTPPTLALLQPF